MKRNNYISWDDLFMGIAELASKRSKDPSTQNGSCIVKDKKVISIGYNGLPRGLSDEGYDILSDRNTFNFLVPKEGFIYDYWDKANKYNFAIHSESNAIVNAKTDLEGATLYLFSEKGYYPCSTCAGLISQSGIVEVVMKTAIKESTEVYNWNYTKHIFQQGNVRIRILNV